jgi:hypothetical protein
MARKKSVQQTMNDIADLGCIICGSPAQLHHIGTHLGGGRDDNKVIGLCVLHHTGGGYGTALHAGKKAFEARFGTEQELFDLTQDLLRGIKC